MRRWRYGVLILFTVAVILVCACFPMIVAGIEDSMTNKTVEYHDVVQLQLFKELNMTQKLYLLTKGEEAEILEDNANLKKSAMSVIAEAALKPYYGTGLLIMDLSHYTMECKPRLFYSNQYSDVSGIFWYVEMTDVYGQKISMYIDDWTGRIMLINHEVGRESYDGIQRWEEQMSQLIQVYQDETGMYENIVPDEMEEINPEFLRKTSVLRIGDVLYGEIGLVFEISENGFAIYPEELSYTNEVDAEMMQ